MSKLSRCARQAADVSAYTQVKLEDAPKLSGSAKSECRAMWIRLPKTRRPKSWDNVQDRLELLERSVHGELLSCIFVGTTIWESVDGIMVGKSSPIW